MKRIVISFLLAASLLLGGCGIRVTDEPAQQDAAAVSETEDDSRRTLKFVDVFGQEYEISVRRNVKYTPYKREHFRWKKDRVSYKDDAYQSRMGIDVSGHQGKIDWKKVKEDGVTFAIIRIGFRGYGSEGTLNPDPYFEENIEGARKEGIDVGVYFFAQAINEKEAKEEADFVLDLLQDRPLQLPVVYDPETILDAPARTDDVTAEQFTRNTAVFCEKIKKAGYEPMIYANMLWEAYELDMEQLSAYPFWYADYEEFPQTPYLYEFWQYTNEGSIDGISGKVDLNIQMLPVSKK